VKNHSTFIQASRRKLPHFQNAGELYFVTFSALPGIHFSPDERSIVLSAIKFNDGKKYSIPLAVVMPTHVHMLILPLRGEDGKTPKLSQIIGQIKGFSAYEIRKQRTNKQSKIWIPECFEKTVTSERAEQEVWNYILQNPVKEKLCVRFTEYAWLYLASD